MKQLLDRLNELSSRLTFNQKVLMGAIAGTAVLSVVIFSFWLQSEEMAVLFTNLSPEDAASALDELGKQNVKTELANGGTTVLVPEDMVYRMRVELSQKGVPSSGTVGWGIFDGKQYGMTEFLQNVNFKRALEGELTQTIKSIRGIQDTRVHLVIPKDSIFKDQKVPATASVVLTLGRSIVLSEGQIVGVQSMVANSVEGLEAPNVSVIDQYGVVLSRNYDDPGVGHTETQLAMKKEVDGYLSGKAESMLDRVLGPGRSIVRVDADLNFDRLEHQRETFDPEGVLLSEERAEETGADGEGGSEESVSNYELNRTVETVVSEVGGVNNLSVAVFVDGRHETPEGGDPVYTPLSDEELQQIERIVKTAVGFTEERGDRVEVVNMPFQDEAPAPVETQGPLASPMIDKVLDVGGNVLLFAVAGFLLLRLRRGLGEAMSQPVTGGRVNVGGGYEEREISTEGLLALDEEAETTEKILEEVKDFAGENTEDMADLVQAWLGQTEFSKN